VKVNDTVRRQPSPHARFVHDLTANTTLAGNSEVVCHNDLAPKNTVYRNIGGSLRPVALIDWDLAAPGRRIHDLAHACWQYLDLGPTVKDVPPSFDESDSCATATGSPTAPSSSRRSCGGKTAAGEASRTARPQATPR